MGVLEGRFKKPNPLTGSVDFVFNWARRSSLWIFAYGIKCCAIEFIAAANSRYDFTRFGTIARATPRQADLMIVAGPVVKKMVPVIRTLYDQMAEPKYVIAMGACAISGGLFQESFNVVRGVDKVIPVDVYIPGCHPRPEAVLQGMLEVHAKIKKETVVKGGD
ncbi:MAG TPA: NADH-quinone oxidoreductase subunit B family protein [Candidatus Subteraquimicrobiales bacterium]